MKYYNDSKIAKAAQAHREAANRHCLEQLAKFPAEPPTKFDIERYKFVQYLYNSYTGIGGLSGEKYAEHDNFHSYTKAKQEFEQGQFFTPHYLAQDIVEMLPIGENDKILDPTCGVGRFFNFCPKEENCYGIEFEENAAKVAKFLYPSANILHKSILDYSNFDLCDFAVCNPPFNLRWEWQGEVKSSQEVFMYKLAEMLKPGAIVALIVPATWLSDDLYFANTIKGINALYAYLGGYEIAPEAFAEVGVSNFATKVLFFQRLGKVIPKQPYNNQLDRKAAEKAIQTANNVRIAKRYTLQREVLESAEMKSAEGQKIGKYLYKMQTSEYLIKYYTRVTALIEQMKEQQDKGQPKGMSNKEWEKTQITPKKVLQVIKRLFKRAEKEKKIKALLGEGATEEQIAAALESKPSQISGQKQRAKERIWANCQQSFNQMQPDQEFLQWAQDWTFIGGKNTECKFNDLQANDLSLILQKRYALLSWEQGSGKTGVAHAWANYLLTNNLVDKVFVVGPALAIKSTWNDHLKRNGSKFTLVEGLNDLKKEVDFYAVSFSQLLKKVSNVYDVRVKGEAGYIDGKAKGEGVIKIYKAIAEMVKACNGRVAVIIDESDEMSNHTSQKSRQTFAALRLCRYKLLTTGTATRNNITELYPQLQFMYNNSRAMVNNCTMMYDQNDKKEIVGFTNGVPGDSSKTLNKLGEPYTHRNGQNDFRRCFNPARTTVLGLEKNTQDIFNADELKKICEGALLVRTFNQVAGEGKYEFKSHIVKQNWQEAALYQEIFQEVQRLMQQFGHLTGNARKDAMFKITRQIQYLIEACSIPHKFPSFSGGYGNKIGEIVKFCCQTTKPILLGCTTKKAVETYKKELEAKGKVVFVGTGETSFKARGNMADQFQKTENSVLICTQQAFKSSININECDLGIVETLPWNLPKLSQFFFRIIRFDSTRKKQIHFFLMQDSIEENLMALLMEKQKLNEFVKTGTEKDKGEMFAEMDLDVIQRAIAKGKDKDGKVQIEWGQRKEADTTGKFNGEVLEKFYKTTNKAGKEVHGKTVGFENGKIVLSFCDENGKEVVRKEVEKEKVQKSTALEFKRFLDNMKREKAPNKKEAEKYYQVLNKAGKAVIGKMVSFEGTKITIAFYDTKGGEVARKEYELEDCENTTYESFKSFLTELSQKSR